MTPERAAQIQHLRDVPAFQALTDEISETRDRYAATLAKSMLATGKPPESEGFPFEYKRGYLAGLRAATEYPDVAAKQLERENAKSRKQEES